MDHDFWHDRWREGRIGFHEGRPNALLTRHVGRLGLRPGGRVFLPLCGKAVDIDWLLEAGLSVIGIDLSREAVTAVFDRLGLAPEEVPVDGLTRFRADRLNLFAGDIFALEPRHLGPVDAVYDRAALVALPRDMRQEYAEYLARLAGPVPQLLITFVYDQRRMDGPPFSVTAEEVAALYGTGHDIERLSSDPVTGPMAGRSGGALEEAWLLTPRS